MSGVFQALQFNSQKIDWERDFIFFLRKELENKERIIENHLKTLTVCLHMQSSMRDERYFSSQSQKFNFTQNKLEKPVITISDNKETFNAQKELASMIKKRLILMRKQLKLILEQTLTKIIVTKKQLLILTIIIPFYKILLIRIMLLQKTHRSTKIRITIKKKYYRAK